jgi:hypothetical protein
MIGVGKNMVVPVSAVCKRIPDFPVMARFVGNEYT